MELRKLQSSCLIRHANLGALTGLLLGSYEAVCLGGRPNPTVLLKPDVTYLIWFLAPLLDGTVAGLMGLGIGAIVAACQDRQAWRRSVRFVRVHWALAAMLAVAAVAANALVGGRHAFGALKVAAILLLVSAISRMLRPLSLKIQGIVLASAFILLLGGVGFYTARPSVESNDAKPAPKPPEGKPNIILITLDTVRADHVSSYGYSRQTTPNLDRWTREGILFENAISPTSWTLASHASMFTGVLPHQHGADWQVPLNTSRWTLADVLRAWGYETVGFSSNFGYGEAGWGLDKGFDLYEDNRFSVLHNLQALKVGRRILNPLYQRWVRPESLERRTAFQVNRDVLDWFHRRSPRPYFLFINYFDVHDPYLPHCEYARQFGEAPPALIRKTKEVFSTDRAFKLSDQDRSALIAGYDNALASLDHWLGELLNSLSRRPEWENTLVIITSDHGEAFGEHGTYSHGENLYNETVHVPLLILGSGVPKDVRVSQVVSTQDLFATILQFAKGGATPPWPTALQRYWTVGTDPEELDESVVSELTAKYEFAGPRALISLRTRQWEYIRDSEGNEELYDWRKDAGERANLAANPEYRPIIAALHARLYTLTSDSRRPWGRPQYLAALDEPQRPVVNFATPLAQPVSAHHFPPRRIGDVQDAFPPHAILPFREMPDTDLLQSLPYH